MSEHYLAVFGAIYRFAVGHCVVGSVEVGETSSMYHTPPPGYSYIACTCNDVLGA